MRAGGRLLLLAALPALLRLAVGEVVQAAPEPVTQGARFAGGQRTRALAAAGAAVELRCTVLHLADRVVSWVRTRDLQILTHAGVVFTADTRVSAPPALPDGGHIAEWDELSEGGSGAREAAAAASVHALRIERLRAGDGGRYECQVNTEPKMSLMFELVVVDEEEPHIEVSAMGAGAAVAGAAGASATLACEARWRPPPHRLLPPPLRLRWLRDGQELEGRGGVSVTSSRDATRAVSRLTLAAVAARDAGRYRCEARARGHAPRGVALDLQVHSDTASAVGDGGSGMQRDEAAALAHARALAAPSSALAPALLALLAAQRALH